MLLRPKRRGSSESKRAGITEGHHRMDHHPARGHPGSPFQARKRAKSSTTWWHRDAWQAWLSLTFGAGGRTRQAPAVGPTLPPRSGGIPKAREFSTTRGVPTVSSPHHARRPRRLGGSREAMRIRHGGAADWASDFPSGGSSTSRPSGGSAHTAAPRSGCGARDRVAQAASGASTVQGGVACGGEPSGAPDARSRARPGLDRRRATTAGLAERMVNTQPLGLGSFGWRLGFDQTGRCLGEAPFTLRGGRAWCGTRAALRGGEHHVAVGGCGSRRRGA